MFAASKSTPMNLPTDGSETSIGGNRLLTARYQPSEEGAGVLSLRLVDAVSFEGAELRLRLAPWSPEGFKMEIWNDIIVLCAAEGIAVLQTDSFQFAGFLAFEYEECERVGLPWLARSNEALVVGTEIRVCCVNRQGTFRWIWSVRSSTKAHWKLADSPTIDGSIVRVPLTSFKEVATVELELGTGFSVSLPRNWKQ